MNRVTIVIIILVLALLGFLMLSYWQSSPTKTPKNQTTKSQTQEDIPLIKVYAKNLAVPWALGFLPDGDILVTERAGKVKLIDKNGGTKEIGQIPVKQITEAGLHGIAVHPKFKKNHYIYLYYTYSANEDNTFNRVSRFRYDGQSIKDEKVIIDKIPGAQIHDGGRIKFGPDGFLYIATGDAANPSLSQDKTVLAGKILRVTDEGKAAPGNPFANLVYSYGHRNPQGMTWDDEGRLWATEHGSQATDELNLIEAGKNYGWPEIRGDQSKAGMVSPILQSGNETWAPAGAAFFAGSIYFGGLRGQALYQIQLDSLQLTEHLKGEFGRIREVVLGPDNYLYITTSNRDGRGTPNTEDDKIIRLDPNRF